MKVEDFAEILYSNTGKPRVLKYTLTDITLLETYFEQCRNKPARLAKVLGIHYQSMRKLLQSAGLWYKVSTINGKGLGDNLSRRVLKNKQGYKFSENPNDYTISYENGVRRSRRKLEHIAVMEKALGRELQKGEVVHHINGDKTDNEINNLFLCTRKEHGTLHKQLEGLAMELVKDGLIVFMDDRYVLTKALKGE